ncbi:MAG TPA: 2-phosphosulfolactate phosphatase [Gaiellaceae bacterium]
MEISVSFTPSEALDAEAAIVVDVIRATSTIAAALASGFEAVRCVTTVEDALALRGECRLAGERDCLPVEGFDFGNSPAEIAAARGSGELALTTTNGTRLLIAACERSERVYAGALANLDAVARAVRASGAPRVAVLCAGSDGFFSLDDAYTAGRFVRALDGDADDSAVAATALADALGSPHGVLDRSRSAARLRAVGLEADVDWCAQVSVVDVVPVVMDRGPATATLRAEPGA